MEIQKIPVYRHLLKYSQRVRINGVAFLLTFRYQNRCDRWFLDISDENGKPIQIGIKCVFGEFLLNKYEEFTHGQLLFIRNDNLDDDPSLNDFGVLAWLAYVPTELIPEEIDPGLAGISFKEE